MSQKVNKRQRAASINTLALRKKLLVIPLIAFFIKIIIMLRIGPIAWPAVSPDLYRLDKFWLGADGENYITGVTGLFADGFLSEVERLTYFPAGYPILIFILGFFSQAWSLPWIALLQTILYAFASAYFVDKLIGSRIQKFTYIIALLLAFNPTLSLSSYAIGYESLVVSLTLIIFGLLITEYNLGRSSLLSIHSLIAATLFSIISFVQPRMIVSALVIFTLWALTTRTKLIAAGFLISTMLITAILPTTLYLRNIAARDIPAISTNLGITINIGIGPNATGGYNNENNGVPCPEAVGSEVEIDNAKVRCALNWYLENPVRTLELASKKAIFFWSPWFGPVANGTMARNPWAQNHPLKSTAQTQEGFNLVYGNIGKTISYLWLLATLFFLGLGFWVLWRLNGVERLLGISALGIILINMAVSMATIGDHRFRLPIAGLSLFLQGIGLLWAVTKGKKMVMGPERALLWKSFARTTNLEA